MPYANVEDRRAMQTRLRADPKWSKKNKAWQAQYRFRHTAHRMAYSKKWKKERFERTRRLLGNTCYLTRYFGDHCKGIFDIHNKLGSDHDNEPTVYEANLSEFVLLCRRHHKMAHDFCMNRMGMSWDEFLAFWGRVHPLAEAKEAR